MYAWIYTACQKRPSPPSLCAERRFVQVPNDPLKTVKENKQPACNTIAVPRKRARFRSLHSHARPNSGIKVSRHRNHRSTRARSPVRKEGQRCSRPTYFHPIFGKTRFQGRKKDHVEPTNKTLVKCDSPTFLTQIWKTNAQTLLSFPSTLFTKI